MLKERIIATVSVFFIIVGSVSMYIAIQIPPLRLKKETFVFEYGVTEVSNDPATYINASEKVLETAQLNLTEVKNEIGLYKATITYLKEEYPFYIKVVDTTKPVTKLKQVQVNVEIGAIVVAKDLLVEVEDNSASVVYFVGEDDDYSTQKEYLVAGTYVENIVVVDSSNNTSAQLRVKIVVGENNAIPTLTGISDTTIEVGSNFDPLENVMATDGIGQDITSEIKIISNDVNVDEPGIYEVIYSVTNFQNNNIQRTRKVVVE